MKKTFIIYTLSIAIQTFLFNLSMSLAQEKKKIHLELETDPIAYLLKGYSFHAAVTHHHFRYSLGIFGIDPPDFLLTNDAFDVFTNGVDFKTDYLFNKDTKGLFVGVQANYGRDRIKYGSSFSQDIWGLNLGIRTGYRFMFGKNDQASKGFYLVPWTALLYATNAKTIIHDGQEYQQAKWVPFPTLHIGWRF